MYWAPVTLLGPGSRAQVKQHWAEEMHGLPQPGDGARWNSSARPLDEKVGLGRTTCRFAPPPIRFTPYSLKYPVPLFYETTTRPDPTFTGGLAEQSDGAGLGPRPAAGPWPGRGDRTELPGGARGRTLSLALQSAGIGRGLTHKSRAAGCVVDLKLRIDLV